MLAQLIQILIAKARTSNRINRSCIRQRKIFSAKILNKVKQFFVVSIQTHVKIRPDKYSYTKLILIKKNVGTIPSPANFHVLMNSMSETLFEFQ